MGDCNICCEAINLKNPEISCLSCQHSTCTLCAEKYLLTITEDAHCMKCRTKWNRYFLVRNLTNSFISKKFKNHRENILLDREKSLLPQTQPDVDIELAKREREKILREISVEKDKLKKRLRELEDTERAIYRDGIHISTETGIERNTTTRKCPVENCRGFLKHDWVCGICTTKTCKNCNEPENENHECDPNNVETMKLLKKDSKPCPSCGTLITKIDGCDQMWCTKKDCHTPFSWKTGRKVNGPIHNPHYIQFNMENNTLPRDPRDELCGGLPNLYTLNNLITRQFNKSVVQSNKIHEMIYLIRNIQHHEINQLLEMNTKLSTTGLRVKFMLNEINEKEFKTKIQQNEKRKEKNNELLDILTMFVHTGTDIMRNIFGDLQDRKGYSEFDKQTRVFDNLIEYTNSQFVILGEVYKVKPSNIQNYTFVRHSI